ncbi:MAG TPA: YihY/virulence factor BrkB family protein [Chloroflexia bacterium]|nr:YihY/virulence factor BrkB family protein [Chloroflexia bacterium]
MLPIPNLVNVFKRSFSEFGKDDIGNLAAALAFATFSSIFPLILFLVTVASLFVTKQQATAWVLQNVPNMQGNGGDDIFLKTVTGVIDARGGVKGIAGLVGLLSLMVSAGGAFATLQTAINRAWGCAKAGSLIKDKVIAFLMVLGVAVVLVISTVVSSILNGIQQGTAGIIGSFPWLWQILNLIVSIGLMTGVITILFRTMPRCKVNWGDVWPAALLTAVLWELLKQLFAYYLGHFANYQAVYGTLGSIIALQTWILFSSMILLFCAEVASEYAGERMDMESARAKAANDETARQRRAAAARQAEADRITAGERERAYAARRAQVAPITATASRETATVFGVAAAAAATLGLIGKALTSRNAPK